MSGKENGLPRVAIGDLAQINPESLGRGTPLDFSFRYLDIQSVTLGSISWKDVSVQRFVSSPSRARRVVRPGDVLLCTVRPYLQAHAYTDWSEREDIVCSTGFAVIRSGDKLESRYLFHHLFFDDVGRQLEGLQTGSNYPAVNESDVRVVTLPLPPLPEQRRIAEVLDTADEAIRRSEALLAKLEQVKAGLLHDLLTRGLDKIGRLHDPEAHPEQFQDSLLGRIPREWRLAAIRDCSDVVTSGSRGWAAHYSDCGALFIRIANLTRSHINLRFGETTFVQPPVGSEGIRTAVLPGDLLISITADVGIIGIAPDEIGEAYVNQHIALARLKSAVVAPRWAGHYLAGPAAQKLFRERNDIGAKAGLNLPAVGGLHLPLPPLPEQRRIAAVLDAHDARIRAERAQLDKLRQIKKGLMHDLLTGKVRVQVPQEAPAP